MALSSEGKNRYQNEILENVYKIRGMILQRAVEIETMINLYLGEHFTSDHTKLTELICLIIAPRVTFENKVQAFRILVDKYNPEFKQWNDGYFNELLDIVKHRNVFAHYPASFSENDILSFAFDGAVTFTKLQNESFEGVVSLYNPKPMKEKDINDILDLMNKNIENLKKLTNSSHPSE